MLKKAVNRDRGYRPHIFFIYNDTCDYNETLSVILRPNLHPKDWQ